MYDEQRWKNRRKVRLALQIRHALVLCNAKLGQYLHGSVVGSTRSMVMKHPMSYVGVMWHQSWGDGGMNEYYSSAGL